MNTLTAVSYDAFEQNLLSLQGNMYNFALSLTADTTKAEDLLQDTSLKVLNNKKMYRENTNFKGWVFTVMRNLFINDYHRTVRTRDIFDANADITYLGAHSDSEGLSTPDRALSLTEINQAINDLEDEYRSPFSMYLEGYKYKEIAQTMDLPIGTVKSRIYFARKKLQESLHEYR